MTEKTLQKILSAEPALGEEKAWNAVSGHLRLEM